MNPLTVPPEQLQEYISRLTPRQVDVIKCLAEGRSDKETATILSISVRAVRRRVLQARAKMGVENRIQLIVVFAMHKVMKQ